ncbi:MAG: lysine--tRNA ligase [Parvibaculales bacterium]
MSTPDALTHTAHESKAWPFEQARNLLARVRKSGQISVVFETGYGPSGLPHIGTFGEVARTSMVRQAFRLLAPEMDTRLICFSDDMDGLRKVPDNVPNKELLAQHLEKPLTSVPDPFGTHDSFGAHNNARLQAFLDQFGFDYEFASATDYYRSGRMNETLLAILANYDAVMNIILPTLGEERRKTYSPFLPICPQSGRVLMVPVTGLDLDQGTISYTHPDSGDEMTTPVTDGRCKLQWKADWAMRWTALGVDYEMAGKDLMESVKLSSRICKAIGGTPPEGFTYELFLDENGEKISKSKGNGLTIEEWLTYASPESLSLYMFQSPRKAKRLHFDVIPKNVDEYLTFLDKYSAQEPEQQLANPVWHIHNGTPPEQGLPVSFSLLLNLVSASNADNKDVLWGFIQAYAPDATPETFPMLDQLAAYAVTYFHDFVKPTKAYRPATPVELEALGLLREKLATLPVRSDAETIQTEVYAAGKAFFEDNLRDWFKALYEILLGQSQGPRFGSFVALYGLDKTIAMIDTALDGNRGGAD